VAAAAPVEPPPPAPAPATPAPEVHPARRRSSADAADPRRKKQPAIARNEKKLLDLLGRKGDAAPVAPVEATTLDTGGAELDRAAVEKTMGDNRAAFGACVSRALKQDPRLRVDDKKATLVLTVRPTGTVSSAWIAETDMDRSPLGQCLKGVSRRLAFPAFQGEDLDITVPLALSAIR
jgi:hypothetical protein